MLQLHTTRLRVTLPRLSQPNLSRTLTLIVPKVCEPFRYA